MEWSIEVWSGGLSSGLVSCVPERQLRIGMVGCGRERTGLAR